MKVAVSFISSNYDLKTTINLIEQTDADYIHVDMMDGEFVPNKNFTMDEIQDLFVGSSKDLDVHLMCVNPLQYIDSYKELNTKMITIHCEIDNIRNVLDKIRNLDIKVGLAINPDTNIEVLIPYLSLIDLVLVMSVVPGKGGQVFMDCVLPKLKELKQLQSKYGFEIAIDGGINDKTISLVQDYVDLVISGSYICKSDNYQQQIDNLR